MTTTTGTTNAARQARYAEAIQDELWKRDPDVAVVARAVMAVADEELAESRAEVERWREMWDRHGKNDLLARAEAAEAETRALQERLTALADDLSAFGDFDAAPDIEGMFDLTRAAAHSVASVVQARVADRLRALAASPAVDATPEPTPADEPYICRHGHTAEDRNHWCDDMGDHGIKATDVWPAPAAEPQAEGGA